MILTLDFNNNTVTTEQGTISAPGLADKKEDILKIIGLQEQPMTELKDDINNLMQELGFANVRA